MRVQVNLATRPYVELRPFFLRLRVVMAVLAVVSLGLAIGGHVLSKKLERAETQMDALRMRTVAAQQSKLHEEARMRQPANAEVLARAHFLNELFLRKSFSWTAVMMDLENVLPVGVQVTSIEPQVAADGDVIIRLRVSGQRDRAVQLVRNLESSRRFLMPRLNGESTLNKEAGRNGAPAPGAPSGTEFDILANYNPLPENEAYRYAKPRADQASVATVEPAAMARPAMVAPARVGAAQSMYPRNGVVLAPHAPMQRPYGPPRPGGVR
jgi:type IV pilus assembly protein PilN